ncbi:hypothetical protein AB1Y20_005241 [Prymnesium parvum]|uniref:non-specific serine/threonine protein kinase n=1 Tax=Prymnesium parvum TaxID=97485 RepID=A0AB34J4T4_PRYPA
MHDSSFNAQVSHLLRTEASTAEEDAMMGTPRRSLFDISESFLMAVQLGDVQKVRSLVGMGVDINQPLDSLGTTPLIHAVKEHNVSMIEVLIASKADLECRRALPPQTALRCAVMKIMKGRGTDVLRMLLAAGANVSDKDETTGATVLHALVSHPLADHYTTISLLCEARASVDAKDDGGCTPLSIALAASPESRVSQLLQSFKPPARRSKVHKFIGTFRSACSFPRSKPRSRPAAPVSYTSAREDSAPSMMRVDAEVVSSAAEQRPLLEKERAELREAIAQAEMAGIEPQEMQRAIAKLEHVERQLALAGVAPANVRGPTVDMPAIVDDANEPVLHLSALLSPRHCTRLAAASENSSSHHSSSHPCPTPAVTSEVQPARHTPAPASTPPSPSPAPPPAPKPASSSASTSSAATLPPDATAPPVPIPLPAATAPPAPSTLPPVPTPAHTPSPTHTRPPAPTPPPDPALPPAPTPHPAPTLLPALTALHAPTDPPATTPPSVATLPPALTVSPAPTRPPATTLPSVPTPPPVSSPAPAPAPNRAPALTATIHASASTSAAPVPAAPPPLSVPSIHAVPATATVPSKHPSSPTPALPAASPPRKVHPPVPAVRPPRAASAPDPSQRQFRFRYAEIECMTGNFAAANKLGEGGSSHVYAGVLDSGMRVAVKRIDQHAELQAFTNLTARDQMANELSILSQAHEMLHPNFVPILGACDDGPSLVVVYLRMEGGTLEERLQRARTAPPDEVSSILDNPSRVRLLLDVARGLAHLHEHLQRIHRDINPSNILLDEGTRGYIGDFGLCCPTSKSHQHRELHGTNLYLAPEYKFRGELTTKVDVYAFGIVVLETMTSLPIDFTVTRLPTDDPRIPHLLFTSKYPRHLHDLWEHHCCAAPGQLARFADASTCQLGEIWTDVHTVIKNCLNPHFSDRPSMSNLIPYLTAIELSVCS